MNFRTYVNDAYDAIDPDRAVTIFDEPFKLHFVPGEKCPYTFDAKTVGDVVDYLSTSRRYGNAPLSWNVKAYNADWNGKGNPDYKRDETLDKAWDNYLSKSKGGEYVHNAVYEAAQEYYREEWSAYPGDDQGDWVFSFQGRQSGHLCLDRWCGNDLRDMCRSEFAEFVASLLDDPVALSKFYVGIVCADQEFTPTKASENYCAQDINYNFFRGRKGFIPFIYFFHIKSPSKDP